MRPHFSTASDAAGKNFPKFQQKLRFYVDF